MGEPDRELKVSKYKGSFGRTLQDPTLFVPSPELPGGHGCNLPVGLGWMGSESREQMF